MSGLAELEQEVARSQAEVVELRAALRHALEIAQHERQAREAAPGDSMRASPAGVRHRALANCAERREGLVDFPPRSPLSATALVPDRGRADFIDAAYQEFPN